MLACVDVDYRPDSSARTAAALFEAWTDVRETRLILHTTPQVAAYQPGAFYLRELPCLLPVLEPLSSQLEIVVVDGYVTLDAAGQPSLGWHLFEALGQWVAVIGVVKTAFRGSPAARAAGTAGRQSAPTVCYGGWHEYDPGRQLH